MSCFILATNVRRAGLAVSAMATADQPAKKLDLSKEVLAGLSDQQQNSVAPEGCCAISLPA